MNLPEAIRPTTSPSLRFCSQIPINGSRRFLLNNSQPFSSTKTYSSLSSTNSIRILKGDITRWSFDGVPNTAIVNSSYPNMLVGGEVDKAIRRAAGPELQAACCDVPEVRPGIRCPLGEARITGAFKLPVSHVIHTAAPVVEAEYDPENLLRNSYRNCLKLAKENNIQHIAFPAVCCSSFGFASSIAAHVAISTVKEFRNDFKEVHFVIFEDFIYPSWSDMFKRLLLMDDVSHDSWDANKDNFQSRSDSVFVSKNRCKEVKRNSSIDVTLADAVNGIVEAIKRSGIGMRPDMEMIQEELEKLGLDRSLFIKAATYLGRYPSEAHLFYGLRDEYKMEWIMSVFDDEL